MKKILAVVIALMMLLGMTASAESVKLQFGPYTYDTVGADEYGEVDNGYSMIEYGDYVVTVEYFDLAGNGFDQAYFDSLMDDGSADSWDIGELLLSIKYGPNAEYPIYAWYVTEPIDTSYPVDAVLYNGALTDDLGNGLMAGIGFVKDGSLLLMEVVSFGNHDLATMQSLRTELLANLQLNGTSLLPGAGSSAAGNISIPAFNPFGGLLNNTGSSAAPAMENAITFGNYAFDTTGCVEYEQDDDYISIDYGSRVIYIEYGTFEENGYSFQELSDLYGGDLNCTDMALLFVQNSDYMATDDDMYTAGAVDYTALATYPDCVPFYCNLVNEYGGGYVTGCVLVTENDIVFFECVSFEFGDTLSGMQDFREEKLGNLYYNNTPVLK